MYEHLGVSISDPYCLGNAFVLSFGCAIAGSIDRLAGLASSEVIV